MNLFGMFLCITGSFFLMMKANERFVPEYPEFWIAVAPLVVGFILLYKYCQEKDVV